MRRKVKKKMKEKRERERERKRERGKKKWMIENNFELTKIVYIIISW